MVNHDLDEIWIGSQTHGFGDSPLPLELWVGSVLECMGIHGDYDSLEVGRKKNDWSVRVVMIYMDGILDRAW